MRRSASPPSRPGNTDRQMIPINAKPLTPSRHVSMLAVMSMLCLTLNISKSCQADDWPAFMHDNARSGVSKAQLDVKTMSTLWVYRSPAPPRTAWSGPPPMDAGHQRPMLPATRDFDSAFFVTAVKDRTFFGSSVTDCAYCVEADTGKRIWTFRTGGPVRFPPSYSEGRVYFGSDDGFVYCADAQSGTEIWRYCPAEKDARLIGNDGGLVTLWPIRTDVAVADSKVYFAASLVPWVEPYLCAINATTGADEGEQCYRVKATAPGVMGGYAGSPLSPMGAMLVSPRRLYLMQGRIAPQVFDRATGSHLSALRPPQDGWDPMMSIWTGAGCYALLTPDQHVITGRGKIWTSGSTLNEFGNNNSQDFVARHPAAHAMVVDGANAFIVVNKYDFGNKERLLKAKGELGSIERAQGKVNWRVGSELLYSLIKTEGLLMVGGDGFAAAHSVHDGTMSWRQEVVGRVYGLAAAAGRLFVCTDAGLIYCFGNLR